MSCQCSGTPPPERKKKSGKTANILAGSLLLLMPKCAMCWAAYLSVFGLAGFSSLAYRPWFLPVAILLCGLTMGRILRRAFINRNFIAFAFTLAAALLIAWQKWTGAEIMFGWLALLLMVLAWVSELKIHWSRPRLKSAAHKT